VSGHPNGSALAPLAGPRRVASGSPYERRVGYCRALRVGDRVLVAGTAPIADDGRSFAPGDAAAQARRCFQIAGDALRRLGSGLHQVVRTRIYLVRPQDWEAVASVHAEQFAEVAPVATAVIVAGLLDPAWLLEVELEADVRSTPTSP
jgi:enamine deaminase RidA (YjgF/YER057c/UK114 family)